MLGQYGTSSLGDDQTSASSILPSEASMHRHRTQLQLRATRPFTPGGTAGHTRTYDNLVLLVCGRCALDSDYGWMNNLMVMCHVFSD